MDTKEEGLGIAIYHCHVQHIGRRAGRSAVAASAYRAGARLEDRETGRVHDFRRKSGVVVAMILTPAGAPDWARDREALWNAVSAHETRKDARLAREVEVALPRELDRAGQLALARGFAQALFVQKGYAVDLAIHDTGQGNPHAHMLMTPRPFEGRVWARHKPTEPTGKAWLKHARAHWAAHTNRALDCAGHDARVDHRSLRDQKIERARPIHRGVRAGHVQNPVSKDRQSQGWQHSKRCIRYPQIDQRRSRAECHREQMQAIAKAVFAAQMTDREAVFTQYRMAKAVVQRARHGVQRARQQQSHWVQEVSAGYEVSVLELVLVILGIPVLNAGSRRALAQQQKHHARKQVTVQERALLAAYRGLEGAEKAWRVKRLETCRDPARRFELEQAMQQQADRQRERVRALEASV